MYEILILDKEALRRKGEGVLAVSLGWFCQSDSQCQAADPESRCIQGICDCILNQKNSTECRAHRTVCHPSTFQVFFCFIIYYSLYYIIIFFAEKR